VKNVVKTVRVKSGLEKAKHDLTLNGPGDAS
jgi:hypothetical protein